MSDCECIEGCHFFSDHMTDKQPIASLVQNRLCRNEWSDCARHRVFTELGREAVPRDLYPIDMERAVKIISSANAT